MILTDEQAQRAQVRGDNGERAIGYWSDDDRLPDLPDLPNPSDYVDESWDAEERAMVVHHLKRGSSHTQWMGISGCRICGCNNGALCLTDGTYIWPEGFAHYVEEHAVKPHQDFIDHVKNLPAPVALELDQYQSELEAYRKEFKRLTDPETCKVRGVKCKQKGTSKCFIQHPLGGSSSHDLCQNHMVDLYAKRRRLERQHKARLEDLVRPSAGYTFMVKQALRRPADYASRSARQQWAIDKSLGILDWEPTDAEGVEFNKRWAAKVAKWKEFHLKMVNEPEKSSPIVEQA